LAAGAWRRASGPVTRQPSSSSSSYRQFTEPQSPARRCIPHPHPSKARPPPPLLPSPPLLLAPETGGGQPQAPRCASIRQLSAPRSFPRHACVGTLAPWGPQKPLFQRRSKALVPSARPRRGGRPWVGRQRAPLPANEQVRSGNRAQCRTTSDAHVCMRWGGDEATEPHPPHRPPPTQRSPNPRFASRTGTHAPAAAFRGPLPTPAAPPAPPQSPRRARQNRRRRRRLSLPPPPLSRAPRAPRTAAGRRSTCPRLGLRGPPVRRSPVERRAVIKLSLAAARNRIEGFVELPTPTAAAARWRR
jgi:hypothetical protein